MIKKKIKNIWIKFQNVKSSEIWNSPDFFLTFYFSLEDKLPRQMPTPNWKGSVPSSHAPRFDHAPPCA